MMGETKLCDDCDYFKNIKYHKKKGKCMERVEANKENIVLGKDKRYACIVSKKSGACRRFKRR